MVYSLTALSVFLEFSLTSTKIDLALEYKCLKFVRAAIRGHSEVSQNMFIISERGILSKSIE